MTCNYIIHISLSRTNFEILDFRSSRFNCEPLIPRGHLSIKHIRLVIRTSLYDSIFTSMDTISLSRTVLRYMTSNYSGFEISTPSSFTNVLTPDFTNTVKKRGPGSINGDRDPDCTNVVEQKEDSVIGRQVVSLQTTKEFTAGNIAQIRTESQRGRRGRPV